MATRPTISPLPTPPNRQSGAAEFASDADAFLSALPTFQSDTNAVGAFIDGRAAAAEQFASNAQSSANTASGHAGAASASATTAQGYASQTAADRQAVEDAVADGPVILVNGQSGIVELGAEDIGLPAGIGTNAQGDKVISPDDPSGGQDGGIWYQVEA